MRTDEKYPSWLRRSFRRDLEAAELTYPDFEKAIDFFKARGLDFNHVPRRGFRFVKIGGGNGTAIVKILWCGPGAVREYLDAPSTIISAFQAVQ